MQTFNENGVKVTIEFRPEYGKWCVSVYDGRPGYGWGYTYHRTENAANVQARKALKKGRCK